MNTLALLPRAQRLSFHRGNAKLGSHIYTFSLPSGHTCPGARECLAFSDRLTGRITDGAAQTLRCFSALMEARFPSVRQSRWRNLELLRQRKGLDGMIALIHGSLPAKAREVRVHVGGDFLNANYFRAWLAVARLRPATDFYAYTKSINFWRQYESEIPANFKLTASEGGRYDHLIKGLKRAKVVFSTEEAAALGLEIDHDDSHARSGVKSFALLLHGSQKKGTAAARAAARLRQTGFVGYSATRPATPLAVAV